MGIILFLRLIAALVLTIGPTIIMLWTILLPYNLRVKIGGPASRLWARVLLVYVFDIKYQFKGKSKIPANYKNFLSVSNHLSYFDILLLMSNLKTPFLLKRALLFTPFGLGAMLSGSLTINRQDKNQHVQIINKLIRYSKNIRAIHLFPEGTRSATGDLLPFKKGSLKMAYRKNLPVLASGIWGTQYVLPKNGWSVDTRHPICLSVQGLIKPRDFSTADEFVSAVEAAVKAAVQQSIALYQKQPAKQETIVKGKKANLKLTANKAKSTSQRLAKETIKNVNELSHKAKSQALKAAKNYQPTIKKIKKASAKLKKQVENMPKDIPVDKTKLYAAVKEPLQKFGASAKTNLKKIEKSSQYKAITSEVAKIKDKTKKQVRKLPKTSDEIYQSTAKSISKFNKSAKKNIDKITASQHIKPLRKKAQEAGLKLKDNISALSKKESTRLKQAGVKSAQQVRQTAKATGAKTKLLTAQLKEKTQLTAKKVGAKLTDSKLKFNDPKSSPRGKQAKKTTKTKTYVSKMESKIGALYLHSDGESLTAINFARTYQPQAESLVGDDLAVIKQAKTQLTEYFADKRQEFDLPIKFHGTASLVKIWQAIGAIPFGKTETYQSIGKKFDPAIHPRVVGMAAGKNPIPIVVPCHRVIAKSGNLQGYAGGLNTKRSLLKLEGHQKV